MDMPDGRFVYRVQTTKVVDDQDLSVLDSVGYQRLVLSACHPLYSAAERIIAFARLTRREPPRVRQRVMTAGARESFDGGAVARLQKKDQRDHQGERDGQHREPVEDLEEHGGRGATL